MSREGGMFAHLDKTLMVLRLVKGLSQDEAARRCGMSRNQLSRYETGQVLPQLQQLERILGALGVGLTELLFTMAQIERVVSCLQGEERSPAETLARDAVAAYWANVTDQHLKISRAVARTLAEQFGVAETAPPARGRR